MSENLRELSKDELVAKAEELGIETKGSESKDSIATKIEAQEQARLASALPSGEVQGPHHVVQDPPTGQAMPEPGTFADDAYTVDQLVQEAEIYFGVPSFVARVALSDETVPLTRDAARKIIDEFVNRSVEA